MRNVVGHCRSRRKVAIQWSVPVAHRRARDADIIERLTWTREFFARTRLNRTLRDPAHTLCHDSSVRVVCVMRHVSFSVPTRATLRGLRIDFTRLRDTTTRQRPRYSKCHSPTTWSFIVHSLVVSHSRVCASCRFWRRPSRSRPPHSPHHSRPSRSGTASCQAPSVFSGTINWRLRMTGCTAVASPFALVEPSNCSRSTSLAGSTGSMPRAPSLFGAKSAGRTIDLQHYGVTTQINLASGNLRPSSAAAVASCALSRTRDASRIGSR